MAYREARTFAGAYYSSVWVYLAATKAEAGRYLFGLLPAGQRAGTTAAALARYVAPVCFCPVEQRLWFHMAVADMPRILHPRRVPGELWGGVEICLAEVESYNYYGDDLRTARVSPADFDDMLRRHDPGCALLDARRRTGFDPALRLRNDSAAFRIAKAMLGSGDHSAMPILADALEEAGCDSASVLNHCRQSRAHHPGCWVLGLALGKG